MITHPDNTEPSTPTELSIQRGSSVAAISVMFAGCVFGITLLSALLGQQPLAWSYVTGAVLALPWQALLGALVGLIVWKNPASNTSWLWVSVCFWWVFALHIKAGVFYGDNGRLPNMNALFAFKELTTWLAWATLPSVVTFVVGPRLALRLVPKFAQPTTQKANALSLCLFAAISVGTSVGAYGPLYYGVVPPWAHALLSPERDTPPEDPYRPSHKHHGHDHEHKHQHGEPGTVVIEGPPPDVDDGRPPAEVRTFLHIMQGDEGDPRKGDSAYPYCRRLSEDAQIDNTQAQANDSTQRRAAQRNVLLVLLRDVGALELADMPTLKRIADASVHFDHFYAAGTRDATALFSIFSTFPPTPSPVLTQRALPYIQGFPARFRAEGYTTRFLQTLQATENLQTLQHAHVPFLRMTGFDAVTYTPTFTTKPLQTFAEAHRDAPYFMAWQTPRFADSLPAHLSQLDEHLGTLYRWYQTQEAPRGTLLVLVGDHAPSALDIFNTLSNAVSRAAPERFRVPFIVAGLPEAQTSEADAWTGRLGGHADIGRTLLALNQIAPSRCLRGRNLLASPFGLSSLSSNSWPERRVVTSVGQHSSLYVHDQNKGVDTRWHFESQRRGIRTASQKPRTHIYDIGSDPNFERDEFAEDAPLLAQMRDQFYPAYLVFNRYLTKMGRFTPLPANASATHEPIANFTTPERVTVVSDRGQIAGPIDAAASTYPGSMPMIQSALQAGVSALAFDIQVTRDAADAAVVILQPTTPLADVLTLLSRRAQPVTLHLRLLLDREPTHWHKLIQAVDTLLQQHANLHLVLHTEHIAVAVQLYDRFHSRAPQRSVGLVLRDSPSLKAATHPDSYFDAAAQLGLDWVSLPANIQTDHIQQAHQLGLRILLTGAPGPSTLYTLKDSLPDAIQTHTWFKPTSTETKTE